MCFILCLLVIAAFVALTQQQELELNSNDTTESSGTDCPSYTFEEGERPAECFRKRREAHNSNQTDKTKHRHRQRRWMFSLWQTAVRYKESYFDFQSNYRVKENRKKENWNSANWKWTKGTGSYCTLDQVRKFNKKWKPPFVWWWYNNWQYTRDLKRFLLICKCKTE
ncbi:uncharacterized protein LOC134181556 isoform X2 [Corticium candelabrum]|uniref:uncharacterized protein LOC134181556 isoform X2 n=1 Tax=Corticium candelabrum TaxID=121492 RepID=UPI002E256A1D|nr:uncharacterized protein LOC134181556 isoform X2 [Corticium candelabrum]